MTNNPNNESCTYKQGLEINCSPLMAKRLNFIFQTANTAPKDKCVEWPYNRDQNGYGKIFLNGKIERVHRVSLSIKLGRPLRHGMWAAHAPVICHNPPCINPNHLREASRTENMNDKIVDGTHVYGESCHSSKLTEAQVLAIRKSSETQVILASIYGVSQSQISAVKTGRNWGHVK